MSIEKEQKRVHDAIKTNTDKRIKEVGVLKAPTAIMLAEKSALAQIIQVATLEALTALWFEYKIEKNDVGLNLVVATLDFITRENKTLPN